MDFWSFYYSVHSNFFTFLPHYTSARLPISLSPSSTTLGILGRVRNKGVNESRSESVNLEKESFFESNSNPFIVSNKWVEFISWETPGIETYSPVAVLTTGPALSPVALQDVITFWPFQPQNANFRCKPKSSKNWERVFHISRFSHFYSFLEGWIKLIYFLWIVNTWFVPFFKRSVRSHRFLRGFDSHNSEILREKYCNPFLWFFQHKWKRVKYSQNSMHLFNARIQCYVINPLFHFIHSRYIDFVEF